MSRFAAFCTSALATTLLPQHPTPGAPRSTIGQSKSSGFCADRSSWVCSVRSCGELRIRRSGVRITLGAPPHHHPLSFFRKSKTPSQALFGVPDTPSAVADAVLLQDLTSPPLFHVQHKQIPLDRKRGTDYRVISFRVWLIVETETARAP